MKYISILFFFILLVVVANNRVEALSIEKIITVAKDGTADFQTIQSAVNSVRDHLQGKVTIKVSDGIYHEKLVIPAWKKNIRILGANKDRTIITGDDYSGKDFPTKDFTGNSKYSTYTSYTVLIQGNDCTLENLTIENTAGKVGQAVALAIEADRFRAISCNILGNQDTLYCSKDGRNYFKSCLIAGTTDFIFGEATAVFQHCVIESLANSYITAASTTPQQPYGFVFFDCELIAKAGVGKVYLGRPWRPYARTVFIRTKMGAHITAEGWHPWPGDAEFPNKERTAYYREYQNSGPGADGGGRVPWSKSLSKSDLKVYEMNKIFRGWNYTIY
ncbi:MULTISPECIES: pectinesterase family protein [Pedobacter]|uniref:pectinesterase family protein n=1 Tax=Pedobacter TaxID=84567 RepID=UPI001E465F6F|nr:MULTISPECIES: pectinesterase family protein [Pedobacter]